MPQEFDAIVIGGGHNGLVAAAYLSRAGVKTLVLERRPVLGGAAVTEEIYPGFKFTVFSYVVSLLRPEIIRDLDLPRHGLAILPLESTLTPLPGGDCLYRGPDHWQNHRNIARFSARDADAYEDYSQTMYFMAKAVKRVLEIAPPDPTSLHPGEMLDLANFARHFMRLEPDQLYTLARLMTMSSADFLERWFESDPLLGTLSASGIIGTFLGPRSPGTAYVLLHHYMGEIDGVFRSWGFARGGTGGISESIAGAARHFGAEIRTNAAVERVLTVGDKAIGVVLSNGDEILAKTVLSSLDPKQTFLKFLEPGLLPDDITSALDNYVYRGSSAKVNLALDAAPQLACLPEGGIALRGAISISPSIDYIEHAYDAAKYGGWPQRPYIDVIIPSMIDPGMAPPGKHVMSCFVQYAPYRLRDGDWESQREDFGNAVVDTLSEYIPNLKDIILYRQVLTPPDIERITGLTEGNIFQGELSLSQLFFLRPAPGLARYRTPVRGYYQCGSAAHPGGGISGAPGRLAAVEVLRSQFGQRAN